MQLKASGFAMMSRDTKSPVKRILFSCLVATCTIFPAAKLSAQNVEPSLVGGIPTLAQQAVGYVRTQVGSCTATLISPTHILTASHCNSYRPHDVNIGQFTAQRTTGGTVQVITRNVKLWIGQGTAVGEDDWAVGVLDSAITDIAPARISSRTPAQGETVTAFGYGCTDRPTQGGTWEKRYREFAYGSSPRTLCPGDSGGPLMIGTHSNAIEIVGVNSGYYTSSGIDIWANAVKFKSHITSISQTMPAANVCYRAHVGSVGWLPMACDGQIGGTTGQSKRMEAIQVYPRTGNICYRSHLGGIGWEGTYKCNGQVSGTVGQSRRMEAIQISTASTPVNYQARAHVSNLGWLTWVDEGFIAGTTGQSRALEAVTIIGY